MPRVTRWYIRTALVYLVFTLFGGVVRSWPHGGANLALAWPAFVHLLTVGWLTQLILGVAYWMFPTPRTRPPLGTGLAWVAYAGINTGLLLRVGVESGLMSSRPAVWLASAVLQWIGVVLIVALLWPRVRGR